AQASYVLQSGYNPTQYSNQQWLPTDVNGDGKTDLVWAWNSGNQLGQVVYLATADGTSFTQVSFASISGFNPIYYSNQRWLSGDVNGDGKADLIWAWNSGDQLGRVVFLATSDGTGFTEASYVLQNGFFPSLYSNQHWLPMDVNGDGKADLVWAWNSGDQIGQVVYLATADGSGFTQASYALLNGFYPTQYSNQQWLPMDVNGDGKRDLGWVWNSGDQIGQVVYLTSNPGLLPDLLNSVSNGDRKSTRMNSSHQIIS